MQTLPQTDPSLFKNQHSIEKIDQKSKERDSHIKVFIRKRPLLKSEFAKTDIITIQNQVISLIFHF